MDTGGAVFIKNMNRQIILENIIERKEISRADLSKLTSLNKVTVSSQVASLLDEKLIVEKEYAQSSGGRKPIILSLNENAAFTLGIDVDSNTVTFILSNLQGSIVKKDQWELTQYDFEIVVQDIIPFINTFIEDIPPSVYGVVRIGIGIHGIVSNEQTIVFTPQHNWINVNIKDPLEQALRIPVFVENSTNLSAYAESVFNEKDADNLLCISTSSGIGMGLIFNNKIYKGFHGFAGEVGHMIIVPEGKPCPCGNKGCWELYASEKSFYKEVAKLTNIEKIDADVVVKLVDNGHEQIEKKLDEFIYYLSIGLNNIINLYNPETIIINSGLIPRLPTIDNKIKSLLRSKMNHYRNLQVSNLGKEATALGACMIGINDFLDINNLRLSLDS